MSEVNISDIREVLRNLVDGTRFTFAQVARETGLSTGVVSGFMNNKYAGDNDRVEKALQRWVDKQHSAAELPEPPRFIETPTVKQIWTAFAMRT
jgi:DNA transposition AAA+ family ATPase